MGDNKAGKWSGVLIMVMIVITVGCSLPDTAVIADKIEFAGTGDSERYIAGNMGMIDFGGKTVNLGERSVKPLEIKNTGETPLTINNLFIDTGEFSFMEETFPALPFTIPAGRSVGGIYLEFSPAAAGPFTGRVFIETTGSTYNLTLTGTGLWQLTLTMDAAGANSEGRVLQPVEVLPGGVKTITTSAEAVSLFCETEFLNEFVEWTVTNAPAAAPEFGNVNSPRTTVLLKDHTVIRPTIQSPYQRVGPGYHATIQAAIDACTAGQAVVVSAGTYSSGSITMKAGTPVYGGYNTGWTARAYKTPAERADASYRTVLNVNGSITASGSGLNDKVVLEGFTINGTGAGSAPVVFTNGTTAGLQYNTITGAASSVEKGWAIALDCLNSSKPLIRYNYITGGTAGGSYSSSAGIRTKDGGSPVVFRNSVTGGTASGTGARSYGIYSDMDCKLRLLKNYSDTSGAWGIRGGNASAESYGLYALNNSEITASWNNISGGTGAEAYAVCSYQGTWMKLDHNNLFTADGTGSRYGVAVKTNSRVYYPYFVYNGVYNCPGALFWDYLEGRMTSIESVNDKYNTDTNKGEAVDLGTAPLYPEYE